LRFESKKVLSAIGERYAYSLFAFNLHIAILNTFVGGPLGVEGISWTSL